MNDSEAWLNYIERCAEAAIAGTLTKTDIALGLEDSSVLRFAKSGAHFATALRSACERRNPACIRDPEFALHIVALQRAFDDAYRHLA